MPVEPLEPLEPRLLMAAQPVITEFLAKNSSGLVDGNGNNSDWIEIQNQGDVSIDMKGWHLTDDSTNPTEWTFPTHALAAGAYMVVFADGSGVVDPAGDLHTNFSLSTNGEVLSLIRPDLSVASQWNADGTAYPPQVSDVSYGTATTYHSTTLINTSAPATAYVPTNSTLDAGWTATAYNDSSWTAGATGVGYDTGGSEDNSIPATLKGDWVADDLSKNYSSGSAITTWSDETASRPAVASGRPLYIANSINGHAVVRFNPADGNDNMRVAAANNPMAGAGDFTIAVVFNTSTAGTGPIGNWYQNAGLVDAEQTGTTNDWGMGISSAASGDQLAAGLGAGPAGVDTTIYSGVNVVGSPKVAIFTRSDGIFSLYINGGDGVSGVCGVAARNFADMVFGSIQVNTNYATVDLAEVQVYSGSMTSAQAYTAASTLGTKYHITITTPTPPVVATMTADWAADSLNAAGNNSAVSSWTSSLGSYVASASGGTPSLNENQLNGHSVIHFTGSLSTQLRVPAANNPMSGATNFSIAVVFRTSTAGDGTTGGWVTNSGIVDAEENGLHNDWGTSINGSGQVAAGIGNPDDFTTYTNSGYDDGKAHVMVYTKSGDTTELYIDGSNAYDGTAGTAARDVTDMVFGSIQTNLHYFTGDIAEVQIYNGVLDDTGAANLTSTLGAKYGITLAPPLYAPLIGLNLQSAMYNVATTADVRIPFTVNNPGVYSKLTLNIEYDDGFVAYLNGTEIARRNAPVGTPTYTSVATQIHPKSEALVPESIDVSAFVSLLLGNGATNVLAIKALNTSAGDPDLLINPTLVAGTSTTGPAYMTAPTPGAANSQGYAGFVQPVTFSVPHGYFTSSFNVSITSATPGATIIYTTDGSAPSLTNGIQVQAASATVTPVANLAILTTTTLLAAAFLDAYIPSVSISQTYIFPATVLNQTNTAPPGAYWSTAVNPTVVNAVQTYSVTQALEAIPSLSLVLPYADMFGPTGIYTNPTEEGDAWERATSVEYFDPNNPANQFQINAGIRISGAADRQTNDPKKSFRLFFSSDYGPSKLNYPIFGAANPQQSFDHLVLKAGHNYTWANPGGTPVAQGDYLRDEFARDTEKAITGVSSAGTWVQLYIDGQYWGLYTIVEEPDATWAAANFGGSKDDYDILQPEDDGLEVVSGSANIYDNLFNTLNSDFSDGVITTAEYAALSKLVDVKNVVDYMLNIFYRGDLDAPVLNGSTTAPRNFYASDDAAINGPVRFTTWDGELGMSDVNENRTTVAGTLSPGLIFQDLKTNSDFDQLVVDETYRLFHNGGALESDSTTDQPERRYDALVSTINIAIVGESARWGTVQRAAPLMRDTDWLTEIASLNNSFFPQRSAIVLAQLQAISQFAMLSLLPPSILINGTASRGGKVAINSMLTLADANNPPVGDLLVYTLDGSDPRASGGSLGATAHVYSSAITLSASQTITVRAYKSGVWSPIDSIAVSVNTPAAAGNIVVSEFDYHPANPSAQESGLNTSTVAWGDSDMEFIELLNTSAQTVDLINARFDKGVTFTFGNVSLAPGQRGVIVANPAAFAARYGTGINVLGTYSGHLSNSGTTIELLSATNAVIQSFAYSDSAPFPTRADGKGSSLEIINTAGNYNDGTNYRASYEYNGTPGTAGAPVTDVVINEVLAAPAAGQTQSIELYNTTAAAVDISGWYLSDNRSNYQLYKIPVGTIIAANGYLVYTAANFDPTPASPGPNDFALNGTSGDSIVLMKATSAGKLTAFADDESFGSAVVGESSGRTATGVFYPQSAVTLGAANSGPRIGPVDITEMMYNPPGGTTNLQYLELQNQTNATVDLSGWSFATGITFVFPAGTTLAPFEAVSLVHFNPTTDAASLAAFDSAYGLSTTARLIGPYTDKLSSKGEDVELVRPDAPRADNPGYTPLLLVDDVTFGIASPWPTTIAGQALARLSNHTFGQDPTNWSAQSPSIDTVTYGNAWFAGNTRYTYTSGTTLDSMTINGTAVVTLAAGNKVTVTGALAIAAGASLNISAGDLIVQNGSLPTLDAEVQSGVSITSSAVSTDTTHLTAIGVIVNNFSNSPLYGAGTALGLFDGQSPSASDVLIKDTYYGDANLDGKVDGSDYALIDNGFINNLSGWYNGDFNYDGKVDGSDYTLIDNAFNTQGSPRNFTPTALIATPAKTIGANLFQSQQLIATGFSSASTEKDKNRGDKNPVDVLDNLKANTNHTPQ